jgi:RNA recognition motif-containing protein
VIVKDLSAKTTEDDLWDFFGDCGSISELFLSRNPSTYTHNGQGLVIFKAKIAVKNALKKSGSSLSSCPIQIEPLYKRPEKELQPNVKQTREEYLLAKRKAKEDVQKLMHFGTQLETNKEIERVLLF